ncbi:hypothetical protein ACIBBB_30680 [Streptomyces sp. NPDC051217]|uniref:hypothetical protein n=1 Tax=Streptomyces sp. NPDC051217 TaxID=3365644 RepID=UPI003793A372
MPTPDELEREFTLPGAVARHDALRTRDTLASPADEDDSPDSPNPSNPSDHPDTDALTRAESLEMLALGEAIARKAGYGRQLSVRSARRAGASWSQIGAALGTSKQAAWEAHNRWIDEQAQGPSAGHWGWDADEVAAARRLTGEPDGS